MKRLFFIFAALVCLLLSAGDFALAAEKGGQPEGAKNSIVARVNGVDITAASLGRMMTIISKEKRNANEDAPQDPVLIRKEALDRLIISQLVYQKAKAEGLTIEQKTYEKALARVKTSLGGEDGYRDFLKREGMTEEDMKAQIEKNLILGQIYGREVVKKVSVTDDDVRKAYEQHKDEYDRQERIVVTDVVFFLKVDDKDSLRKAGEVLGKIRQAKDQNPYALTSDGTFVVRDVQLTEDRDKTLCDEAKKLKEGELSGVIRTPDSLHIIKLIQYVPEKQFSLKEAWPVIKGKLRKEAREKRMQEWENELKKEAKIEIIETDDAK